MILLCPNGQEVTGIYGTEHIVPSGKIRPLSQGCNWVNFKLFSVYLIASNGQDGLSRYALENTVRVGNRLRVASTTTDAME